LFYNNNKIIKGTIFVSKKRRLFLAAKQNK